MEEKVCVFDIDGVLNYYPQTWVNFVNETLGTKFRTLDGIKHNVTYAHYKKLKEQYRISGVKAELKPRNNAIYLLNWLKKSGYTIVLISARPVRKYPCLYEQTVKWLDSRGIPHDNLIFSDTKQFEVIKYYPFMEFMVEDNRLIANIMSKLGYKVFLMNNEYNKGAIGENVRRVNNLLEVKKYASE